MHKRMSPYGDYDHMGEAINLVENFKVEKVIFNCGVFNDLEQELIKEFQNKGLGDYTKNDTNIFEKVTSEEKLHTALKNYDYMEELNTDGQASQRNSMTKVYKIIDGLKEFSE